MEVFFGNLPQKNLSGRFKSVGVKKGLILHKRPALPKPAPPKASQPPNGSQQGKPPIGPEAKDRQDDLRDPIDCSEMPDLELVAHPGPPSAEGGPPAGPPAQALLQPPVQYAVPFEMRSLFLIQMLKACFREAGWLLSAPKVSGRAALMVTESFPQTPFFWAIRLTKECPGRMEALFWALGQAESGSAFLSKREAQRGGRCLAECPIGEEGSAWNRAWILERVGDLAVVFFVDFGHSATRPLTSLRKLEEDTWWSVGPLAQPFMLQGQVFPPHVMRRRIVEGTVAGPLEREPHILKFVLQGEVPKDSGEV
ncbi:tudor domain-containing protein 10 isoform X2 [Anolis carolinensis]